MLVTPVPCCSARLKLISHLQSSDGDRAQEHPPQQLFFTRLRTIAIVSASFSRARHYEARHIFPPVPRIATKTVRRAWCGANGGTATPICAAPLAGQPEPVISTAALRRGSNFIDGFAVISMQTSGETKLTAFRY